MQKIISELQWSPSGGIILERNATNAVKAAESILVVAGPGAGKTELLAQKAGFLFQTNKCKFPQKILAISFKTDAAANLKERIQLRYSQEYAARFTSLTYDAFAKKILDQFRMALPQELRPEKDYVVEDKNSVDTAFKKAGFVNSSRVTRSKLTSYYESVISTTKLPLDDKSLGSDVWQLLLKGFDNTAACLTFKMINMLAAFILSTNPYILKSLQSTYSYVFLDEFQDTTDLQYDLVKRCFKKSNTIITAVGDGKQRIMIWAGARKTVFEDFQQDFSAVKIPLLMNHRSAPRLVNLQRLMCKSLQESSVNLKTSEKWDESDGDIKLFLSENEELEAKYIVADINDKIADGIEINDICILVKQLPGNYTDAIISELEVHSIRARIENDYQDLIKEFITNLILNTLTVSIKRRSPVEWEYITNAMIELRGVEPSGNPELYYQEHVHLIELLNGISAKLTSDIYKEDFETIIEDIVDFFGLEQIKASYPAYSQGDFFRNTVEKLVSLVWNEFELCNDWICSIENFLGIHSIAIMTIHKSKGLEYNSVYFIGLEDGAFWSFKNQPDEDRCAFFVALSRAKEHLSFSFCSYRSKLRDSNQTHNDINEFFELLRIPDIATVITCE